MESKATQDDWNPDISRDSIMKPTLVKFTGILTDYFIDKEVLQQQAKDQDKKEVAIEKEALINPYYDEKTAVLIDAGHSTQSPFNLY